MSTAVTDRPETGSLPAAGPPGLVARVRGHLSEPLFRNAYSLLLSFGLTGLTGLVFWVLAARKYDPHQLGENTALISAMQTLSTFAQLDFAAMLLRFLPLMRRGAARRIAQAYGITSALAFVLAAGFVLVAPRVSDKFSFFGDAKIQITFVLAAVVWGVFAIQDGILTGLQRATVVPIENATYAVTKLILLVVLAGVVPGWGVFVAWILPLVFLNLVVNYLIFKKYLPEHEERPLAAMPLSRATMVRYIAYDYFGSLFGALITVGMPVIVLVLLGATESGLFYPAWTLVVILEMVAFSLASSLLVEGSYEPGQMANLAERALRRGAMLLLPLVAFVELTASFIFKLFGGAYGGQTVALMRVLAVGVIFRAVVVFYASIARLRGQVGRVLLTVGSGATFTVAAAVPLSEKYGIIGIGWAYTGSFTAVAIGIALPLHRLMAAGTGTVVPAVAPGRLASVLRASVAWVLPVGALVAGVYALLGADATKIGQWGLISALPPIFLAAFAVVIVSFMASLWVSPHRQGLLGGHVVALIVLLSGAEPLVARESRLGVSWLLAGFVDQISTTHTVPAGLDARFSWPSFFAATSGLLGPAGLSSARPLFLFAPVIFDLLYLGPLLMIGRALTPNLRTRWFGVFLFFLVDWVGQTYFSPQAIAMLLLLVVLAIVVTYLRPRPTTSRHRIRRAVTGIRGRIASISARLIEPGLVEVGPGTRTAILGVAVVVSAALVITHQLTPPALILDLAALLLVRRLAARGLPFIVGVMLVVFISFLTEDYWKGHLADLFGGGGAAPVTSKIATYHDDTVHPKILLIRYGLTAIVWIMAAAGAIRQYARKELRLSLVVLALAPLPIPIIQPYGGEAILRAYLYTLPFMSLLLAGLIFGGRAVSRRAIALGTVLALAFGGVTLLARYGNEDFEWMRPGEVQAVEYVYATAPLGSGIVAATDNLPWKYERILGYDYGSPLTPTDSQSLRGVLATMPKVSYVILTTAQQNDGITNYEQSAAWMQKLSAVLRARPDTQVVYANKDALVLKVTKATAATTGTGG